jgi:hypothetical protein
MALIDWIRRNLNRPQSPDSRLPDSVLPTMADAEQAQDSYGGLNFYSAIQSHQKWKSRLTSYVRGESDEKLDAATICLDDRCPLGRWLHHDASVPHAQFGIFQRLIEEHAEFYRRAAEVVTLAQSGARESALHAVARGDYARISHKVVRTLSELYRALSEPKSHAARMR